MASGASRKKIENNIKNGENVKLYSKCWGGTSLPLLPWDTALQKILGSYLSYDPFTQKPYMYCFLTLGEDVSNIIPKFKTLYFPNKIKGLF